MEGSILENINILRNSLILRINLKKRKLNSKFFEIINNIKFKEKLNKFYNKKIKFIIRKEELGSKEDNKNKKIKKRNIDEFFITKTLGLFGGEAAPMKESGFHQLKDN